MWKLWLGTRVRSLRKLTDVFAELRGRGEGCLVGFTMAGDPDQESSLKVAQALLDGGVDVLEVGIPFSDPIADGPSIQAAAQRALTAGMTPRVALRLMQEINVQSDSPLVILTYYNIIYRFGLGRFFQAARRVGVQGVVVPDLPVDEAHDYRVAASREGVHTIFLATPATPQARLTRIASCSTGFLYLVSVFGVTGARSAVQEVTIETLRRAKSCTNLPVAVGFGISKPEHVGRLVANGADGVIVGSLLSDIIGRHLGSTESMCDALRRKVAELKTATRNHSQHTP